MPATAWPASTEILRLARRTNRCTVLGPGTRAVLWVQGCPFRCPGCIAPETLAFDGGQVVDVALLAEQIVKLDDIEGVSFSGGEPMSQATALVRLVDLVRGERNLSFMSYTGFTLDYLHGRGTAAQKSLLERLDILIDGPYVAARHSDLRWRGSDNQQVHFLSSRYRHLADHINQRGRWLEFEYSEEGLGWMGIPPLGFTDWLERQLSMRGIQLTTEDER